MVEDEHPSRELETDPGCPFAGVAMLVSLLTKQLSPSLCAGGRASVKRARERVRAAECRDGRAGYGAHKAAVYAGRQVLERGACTRRGRSEVALTDQDWRAVHVLGGALQG
eukprot:1159839-Pelagomonas_calceolata.AAC.7